MRLLQRLFLIGFLLCIQMLPAVVLADETDSTEIQKLRELANKEIEKNKNKENKEKKTIFKAGGLSLQSLNPEFSVTGDMFCQYKFYKSQQNGPLFRFRGLGLHFESYLDPYSKFKAAVPVSPDGVGLGEAYFTRYGLLTGLNLTLGKFRQQLGVINRWHKHGLDQFDFPLALRMIFGDGGLNQIGLSFKWLLPFSKKFTHNLIVQLTNGENTRLFGGNILSIPSVLGHYKIFKDLTKNIYTEFGVSGLWGWNDSWNIISGDSLISDNRTLSTRVYGVDFVMLWEPTGRMRYRNVEWRTELYVLDRDIVNPVSVTEVTLNAYGGYSYLQTKLLRTLDIGFRLDYYKPDYIISQSAEDLFYPLVSIEKDAYRWQISPYLTWQQSPFVKFRIEYDHIDGKSMGEAENIVTIQSIFAAGPHKHERY